MLAYDLPIKNNPLKTREDLIKAMEQIAAPLKKHYSPKCAFVHLGNTSAHYPEASAEMEAFSRLLWGFAPLWSTEEEQTFLPMYSKGLVNGTDPDSDEYWGDVSDFDQKIVEMAAIALALSIATDKIWKPLSDKEKDNVYHWLDQVNHRNLPSCNWLFFRVLVNSAFILLERKHSEEILQNDLKQLDTFYIDGGWYYDGKENQIDYYIPFAMHFYGLVYAKLMRDIDPERSKTYKERSVAFAKDFIYWFANDGAAIPFGRSLTYRFAQSSFFSALVYAGVEVEGVSLGVIKSIVLNNLRDWFSKPIFNADGILTIGYGYPNLIMSEKYNAPGSPYWSLKTFLLLALEPSHPFWRTAEEKFALEPCKVLPQPRMIITRDEKSNHVLAYTVGQFAEDHGTASEKYEKFVYSNKFAFSVPRGNNSESGAYDNTLAISESGMDFYRMKRGCERFKIGDSHLYEKSLYMKGVTSDTYIVPFMPWHVRIHVINSAIDIDTLDGGFSIAREMHFEDDRANEALVNETGAFATLRWGISGIVDETGNGTATIIRPYPNTNLMAPLTLLPTVAHRLKAGRHVLVSSVIGDVSEEKLLNRNNKPEVIVNGNQIVVKYSGSVVEIII